MSENVKKENEIVVVTPNNTPVNSMSKFDDMGFDLVADMTTAKAQYCSMKADTDKAKAEMFNAINAPEFRVADFINKTILAKDIYIEVVECVKQETGEVTACPRIVIIDSDNKAYQCVSVGIYSAIKKVIQFFGEPTWEKPIPLEVKQVTKADRKMLTLNIAK